MYREEAGRVVLEGSICGSCRLVAFPAERYGCERCGTLPEAHQPRELEAAGTVRAGAIVYRHAQPDPPTPFVVVSVALDDGPAVRALLAGPAHVAPPPGTRVSGAIVRDRLCFRVEAAHGT